MQFPSIKPRVTPPAVGQHFLACHIEESFVTVVVWGIEGETTVIYHQANPKEWLELKDLGDAVEMGLEELHSNAEGITSVLFGLPESWVAEDDILEEYKSVLKTITQKLSFSPLGFVVTSEALFQHMSRKNAAAAQMLFVECTPSELVVSLVERGNRKQMEKFGRSEDLLADLAEGLARLKEKPYPPQIYLYSVSLTDAKLEEEKQLIETFDWKESGLFVHLPQVDIVNRKQLLEAICLTGGLEVVKSMGLIGESKSESPELKVPVEETPIKTDSTIDAVENEHLEEPEYAIELDDEATAPQKRSFTIPFLTKKNFARLTFNKQPKWKMGAGVIAALVILLIMTYAAISMQSSVTVVAKLQKESINSDVQITLSPTGPTDPENNLLQVTLTKKEVTDSQETSTTGTKIIGEKATGTVTILNKTESDKTFSKGTEISSDKLVFVLDEDVTVASSSAKETGDGKTLEFGKKDVKVTAVKIGAEYNINKDTELSVANFGKDTYAARATDNFGGGTSREIQAVAQSDRTKLATSLKEELLKKAKEELTSELKEGQYVILTGKSTVSDQTYSAKVEDEVDSLKLTMTLSVEAYLYQTSDLAPIAQAQLKSQIPEGGALLEDSITSLFKENTDTNSTASAKILLDAKLSAEFVPATDQEGWINEIKGKSLVEAISILENKKEIESVEVTFSPSIAKFIAGKIPSKLDKISFSTTTE